MSAGARELAGSYINYHSDHSVPSDVCFEDYNFMMELIEQYGCYR
jgi:hypothetical protein